MATLPGRILKPSVHAGLQPGNCRLCPATLPPSEFRYRLQNQSRKSAANDETKTMQLEKIPLSKTVTQAPSLQLAHSTAQVVLRDKLIDLQPVCTICAVKKSTVYAWLKDPESDFPRPIRLSARMVRWSENSVLTWVQDRINQATQPTAVQS